MPITSSYDIGRVSFISGSTTVTGSDTNWAGAGIREGDIFWSQGLSVRVLELVDNESLTLAFPWPGETVINAEYEVRYTADTARVMARSTAVLNAISQTGLNMIGELEPVGNQMPYYTSPDTAALTGLSVLARELLELETAPAWLTALGLVRQASRTDAVAGRLLTPGAFGLGAAAVQNAASINNTNLTTGIYGSGPTSTGDKPVDAGATDAFLHIKVAGFTCVQLYFSTSINYPIYHRRSTAANTWAPWKLIDSI